jgi:hypothetical protein
MAKKGRPVPFSRNCSHFIHIQNSLTSVLNKVKAISDLGAKPLWVSCRLNRTQTEDIPVFVGWVEDTEAAERRSKRCPYSPVEMRFGDTHPSKLYSDCLKTPLGKVVKRKWEKDSRPLDKTYQQLGPTLYGETDRRSVPINVNNKCVGTLNAAFSGDPGENSELEKMLLEWAQTSKSPLVKYIGKNLDVSGPAARA